uniref:AlNc14C360G10980 protein n=1 Tax=Albugo laibachii Nc14 TaxID=890382 RepID=F0WXP5_9STRA|nr:AlNc14C360G10980 [Albugo laibachii Nc14]|eukprot:CCA26240.1 AlNc14C360G10980 [Albugo laibachii Nc14]
MFPPPIGGTRPLKLVLRVGTNLCMTLMDLRYLCNLNSPSLSFLNVMLPEPRQYPRPLFWTISDIITIAVTLRVQKTGEQK